MQTGDGVAEHHDCRLFVLHDLRVKRLMMVGVGTVYELVLDVLQVEMSIPIDKLSQREFITAFNRHRSVSVQNLELLLIIEVGVSLVPSKTIIEEAVDGFRKGSTDEQDLWELRTGVFCSKLSFLHCFDVLLQLFAEA